MKNGLLNCIKKHPKQLILACKSNLTACSKQVREESTREKAKKENEEENKPKIIITAIKSRSEVEFTITDQGAGIPKEELVTIFEPFTVGSKTRTISGYIPNGQRGIGLTLCKLAIEAHGGKIWAESDNNEGVKFIFTLPMN